ncbi:methyltransferase domain-containing protein [Fusobacterium sp. MFO224]|uniref:methyltransferase domain-containing protein n=1 Tax=Fusobacterium sp. MFO224 TaxID=3378070 RepID=UPI00385427DE
MKEFDKNFSTYDDNAIVQKEVAKKLTELIKHHFSIDNYSKVMELGCGTGIFTRHILNNIKIEKLVLNDYFNTEKYLEGLKYEKFVKGDMSQSLKENYDLIISSSSFQWIEDLENLIKNISGKTNNLAFSIYITGNLKEIQEHFDITLNYKTRKEIVLLLKKYFSEIESYEEERIIKFKQPMDALRHLKKTGVGINSNSSVQKIRTFSEKNLSYSVGYFLCSK